MRIALYSTYRKYLTTPRFPIRPPAICCLGKINKWTIKTIAKFLSICSLIQQRALYNICQFWNFRNKIQGNTAPQSNIWPSLASHLMQGKFLFFYLLYFIWRAGYLHETWLTYVTAHGLSKNKIHNVITCIVFFL